MLKFTFINKLSYFIILLRVFLDWAGRIKAIISSPIMATTKD